MAKVRVHALAKELGLGSHALLGQLREMGFGVTAPASGLSEAEAKAIRKAFAVTGAPGDAVGQDEAMGQAQDLPVRHGGMLDEASRGRKAFGPNGAGSGVRYRLFGKGSVAAGPVRVRKGETVSSEAYAGLPCRVQAFFEVVGQA